MVMCRPPHGGARDYWAGSEQAMAQTETATQKQLWTRKTDHQVADTYLVGQHTLRRRSGNRHSGRRARYPEAKQQFIDRSADVRDR